MYAQAEGGVADPANYSESTAVVCYYCRQIMFFLDFEYAKIPNSIFNVRQFVFSKQNNY